jgi:hypothetical protein
MTHPAVIWIGAIVSLGVFSYLIKDNLYYRIVQQTALGVTVGMGMVLAFKNVLWPNWINLIVQAANGTAEKGSHAGLWWILAIIPGALWYFQLSKKHFGISTIITGLFIGVAAGTAFKVWLLLIMPQIGASLKPLNPFAGPEGFTGENLRACLNNLVFVVAIFTTLLYFFFSFKGDSPIAQRSMRAGRIMIMVALGSMFGATVMTRLAYLLERLRFLFTDWFMNQIIHGIFG